MKIPIKLSGLEVMEKVITDIVKNVEFKEGVTEEYKRGFFDFGNAAINALIKMQQAGSGSPETNIIIAGNGQNYEVINK